MQEERVAGLEVAERQAPNADRWQLYSNFRLGRSPSPQTPKRLPIAVAVIVTDYLNPTAPDLPSVAGRNSAKDLSRAKRKSPWGRLWPGGANVRIESKVLR
ncbi:uncharacterized protein PGTG_07135 [Puccinia graminis f. sp. tritici CRL 75-36-700-3]|uniref:Uncharacterized protein n=1 Tax=Puccinia graminis f. sp. tritici (strain CRL 75-36-700-3 / race SCCL) TaxID=418459 RepID=E3K9E4_PUCGT|nr:uncharacterized protein PGTG_07135 [Puccinia graminis f. sp. tritici CRL 75-36-700-3]EFP80883.2 hypothetical protein PGTG_07135 [Puccinia graminis f. sp. tritici CRL 75-36-700-3]